MVQFFSATLFGLFLLATATGHAAGLIWLWLFLAGLACYVWHFHQSNSIEPTAALGVKLAGVWLVCCVLAAVLIFIPTAYWGGPWPERHPQWRLLIAALGVYWITCYARLTGHEWIRLLFWALMGISLSLVIALAGVVVQGSSTFAPTNRIPWMAGVSVLVCAAMAAAFELRSLHQNVRKVVVLCALLTVLTVMFSGVRGSWSLIIVLPIMLLALNHFLRNEPGDNYIWFLWVIPLGALALSAGSLATENPWPRLLLAINEVYAAIFTQQETATGFNSSVGIRLGMYWMGLENALSAGWIGHGQDTHKAMFSEMFQRLGTPEFIELLSHYHSDILNPWVEFGVMGLMSYFCYSLGLIYMAVKLWCTHKASSIGVFAVLAMHLSTGLTNANFAHNYYPLMLSLSVALIVFSVRASER